MPCILFIKMTVEERLHIRDGEDTHLGRVSPFYPTTASTDNCLSSKMSMSTENTMSHTKTQETKGGEMASSESNPDKAMSGVHPVLIHTEEDVDVFHGVANSNDTNTTADLQTVGGMTEAGTIGMVTFFSIFFILLTYCTMRFYLERHNYISFPSQKKKILFSLKTFITWHIFRNF